MCVAVCAGARLPHVWLRPLASLPDTPTDTPLAEPVSTLDVISGPPGAPTPQVTGARCRCACAYRYLIHTICPLPTDMPVYIIYRRYAHAPPPHTHTYTHAHKQ